MAQAEATFEELKGGEEVAATQPVAKTKVNAPSRDARDVALIYKLLLFSSIHGLLTLVLAGTVLWLLHRKPDLVLIDDTSDKRVVLNNREFGSSAAASLMPNQPLDRDKISAAKRFLALKYNVDQKTLGTNVETALGMVVPQNSQIISNYWTKCDGAPDCVTLAQQRSENWQAVWTPQRETVDSRDPYLIHIIGVQKVTRMVNNQMETYEKQYQFHVKLSVDKWMAKDQDGNPRHDRNFNTGYLILLYTGEEIKTPS